MMENEGGQKSEHSGLSKETEANGHLACMSVLEHAGSAASAGGASGQV